MFSYFFVFSRFHVPMFLYCTAHFASNRCKILSSSLFWRVFHRLHCQKPLTMHIILELGTRNHLYYVSKTDTLFKTQPREQAFYSAQEVRARLWLWKLCPKLVTKPLQKPDPMFLNNALIVLLLVFSMDLTTPLVSRNYFAVTYLGCTPP